MTVAELLASEKIFLTPSDICCVLESDPQTIRLTAREYPERIGFPFTFIGSHMKIPRVPFLRFIGVDVCETPTYPLI